ncbi:MAG TPA: HdeA/HdeB family chaperone [Pseudolabrys sp.]|nr:HdeA/HdeB family chaperone [Pseudolabrys sp.]
MKILAMLTAAAFMCAAVPAQAQQLDLATVKCKDFVSSDQQTIGLILMWLEGYYSESDAKPVVDFDVMKENGSKLGEYCGKNPDHSLITAADEVMGK